MSSRPRSFDRRHLLRGGAALAAAWGAVPLARAASPVRPREDEGEGPVLVLVQLAGGNDGLSMVVPHGDDAYHAARPGLRLAPDAVRDLDGYRGLHPALERLHRHYQRGALGIVEGVGYPRPIRSHFKSFDVWHAADARGRGLGEGWIGRLVRLAFGDDVQANRVVHVGASAPYSLFSAPHPASTVAVPAAYRWVQGGDELDAIDAETAEAAPAGSLGFLRQRLREARASSVALREAVLRYRTPVAYPTDPFAGSLRSAAALVQAGIGTRVVSVELSGFDTHENQAPRHERLMGLLDGGLAAFLEDLERSAAGRRAVVLVFSEFGRRVAENGSRGTDHGCAGPMLVAGARVRGGLHGRHPSLTELDDGDLVHTVDFRSVYAAAIEACFELPAHAVLGKRYPKLELFA